MKISSNYLCVNYNYSLLKIETAKLIKLVISVEETSQNSKRQKKDAKLQKWSK